MGYNDESLSVKINRFANAIGSTASSIYESKVQKDMRMQEITLQRARYLDNLDANVYSASSQKALKGIESLFYGNSKTGTSGFFKDQLNGMDYELYQQNTDAMIAETLSVEYLSKNYGMTESHAQRFIDEYGSTITAEANQRTQTNTFLSMQTQLGSDMEAFTTLQANGGTSAIDQYQNIVKHYNDVGGSSWDITGTYNPEKIENRLSFGYEWSISAGKRAVDDNIGKNGITSEQIIESAMSLYDTSMAEMGDGSNISNATISSNREQYESSIRSYLSMRAGQMYTESQDKARNASNAYTQILLDGGYVDDAKFDELLADAGLSKDNVYDLSFIHEMNKTRLDQKSLAGSSASQEKNLLLNEYYNNYFNNYACMNEECESEVGRMVLEEGLPLDEASKLYAEIDKRETFATRNFETVSNYIVDYLDLDPNNKNAVLEFNNNPSFKTQITKTLLSHPEWDPDDLYKYARQIALEINDSELGKTLDSMLELKFSEATGYEPNYDIASLDKYNFMAGIYSGKYAYLLNPAYSDRIAASLSNGAFSDEKDMEDAVSQMMFGKDYSSLSSFEKNSVQANITYSAINADSFSTVTSILGQLNKGDKDYRMVDIYRFGAGAMSDNLVYFIDNTGYMNIGMFEVGDANWKAIQDNNGSYGVQIDPASLKGMKRMNISENLERLKLEKEEKQNAFGPLMKDVNEQISNQNDQNLLSEKIKEAEKNYVNPWEAWGLDQEQAVFEALIPTVKSYGKKGAVNESK